MAVDAHTNFAYSTLASGITAVATSLTVQTGDGGKFPTTPFNATVWPAGVQPTTTNAEIIRVVTIAGDSFSSITRGQEGTTGLAFNAGDQIAATITAKTLTDAEPPTLSRWVNLGFGADSGGLEGHTVIATTQGSLQVVPFNIKDNVFPGHMTANSFFIQLSGSHSAATASTAAKSYSIMLGIYTVSGTSTLALLNSVSGSFGTGAAASNQSASYNGVRYFSFVSSQWSASPTFSQRDYYLGYNIRSAGETFALSWMGAAILRQGVVVSGTLGSSAATNASMGMFPFMGVYSASTAAMPASIHITQLGSKTNSSGMFAPLIIMENEVSAF